MRVDLLERGAERTLATGREVGCGAGGEAGRLRYLGRALEVAELEIVGLESAPTSWENTFLESDLGAIAGWPDWGHVIFCFACLIA